MLSVLVMEVRLRSVVVIGLKLDDEVREGDDIARLFVEAARKNGVKLCNGDIVVVSHKIVSKAEGRVVCLHEINPSEKALELASVTGKDPRLLEVVLREAKEVLKVGDGHVITLTKHGIVCANSGVDRTNSGGAGERVVLLPEDPDASARRIRENIMKLTGTRVAVVIIDTYGRPFREGVVNMAIGFSGINPFRDYRGKPDRDGYLLRSTRVNIVDEIACAAELVMGQGNESVPFAIVRGVEYEESDKYGLKDILMSRNKWLFK